MNQIDNFLDDAAQIRDIFQQLLSEFERARQELIKSEKQRQALEARTRTLDRNLKMEKELCQSLIVENIRIKQELDSRPTIKMPQSEGSRRGRKRSIDFRNESRDEPTLLRKVRRSSSVPSSNQATTPIQNFSDSTEKIKRRSFDGSTVDLVVSRQHKLESKRNYLSGIVCDQCKKPVGYCCMYVKCDECKLSYHQPCSRQLNMPCLPSVITPKRDLGTFKALRLADFCPESSPKIPHLIVHCVMYLEKSVSDVFLYRTLGDDKQADKLLTDFKTQRTVPDLSAYSDETIAGCIIMFLIQIRDPLILISSHKEFFRAENEQDLIEAIDSLPICHRDTLVYLLNHWKRLNELTLNKELTLETLSRFLGPIVFGTSRPLQKSSQEKIDQSCVALLKILQLPFDVIKQMICPDENSPASTASLSRTGSDSRKNRPIVGLSIRAV